MNSTQDINKHLLDKIIEETKFVNEGTDIGIASIYSLVSELFNSTNNPIFKESCSNLKASLDPLLNNKNPFDSTTIKYLNDFIEWAIISTTNLNDNCIITLFDPINENNLDSNLNLFEPSPNNLKDFDTLLTINTEEDYELLSEFVIEIAEHLETIDSILLKLDNDPTNETHLNIIFRAFHTIKGCAGFLNLHSIQALTHEIETLLAMARTHQMTLNPKLITLILQSKDTIHLFINQINAALKTNQQPNELIPVSNIIIQINTSINECLSNKLIPNQHTDLQKNTNISQKLSDIKINPDLKHISWKSKTSSTIRINTEKMDDLIDMIGELSILQSQIKENSENINQSNNNTNNSFQENLQRLSRITKALQYNSMSLRMLHLKPTFHKTSRVARDTAKLCNKKIELKIQGDEIELDRIVIERINDPLLHMIRNSIDHGIETPQQRKKANKPEAGQISLSAYHAEGNIIIEIKDDGCGINTESVLKKARDMNLISENSILTEEEIQQLIFQPGFSTASQITGVSGRGVGMDIVRQNIEDLHGQIKIFSTPGKGTTFKMQLPLTLAIIDGLLVQSNNEKFILPAISVKNVIQYSASDTSIIQEKNELLTWQNKTIPLINLSKHLDLETSNTTIDNNTRIIVILESLGNIFGVLLDKMLDKQEYVIKNLGSFFKKTNEFTGGAILGDGSIALILDPHHLLKFKNSKIIA